MFEMMVQGGVFPATYRPQYHNRSTRPQNHAGITTPPCTMPAIPPARKATPGSPHPQYQPRSTTSAMPQSQYLRSRVLAIARLGPIYVFFTLFGVWVRGGGGGSPQGLVHNLLRQFFTVDSSKIARSRSYHLSFLIPHSDNPLKGRLG